jgi:glycosyltransferase involved in cell wall biosynthesis
MKKSRLILIIPHYNSPNQLNESIASIDEQIDVDILIVDDGSDTKPHQELLEQSYRFGNIFFESLQVNSGIGVALNHGIDIVLKMGYELIGRLDCGDLFVKDKCFKQINYLDAHKDIKLLGTWARVVDENKQFLYELKHPTDYESILKNIFLNSVFLHPSVIFYSSIIQKVGNYPHKYRRASQDYAFFFKIIKHFKAENYPEILVNYISEPNSISTKKRKLQVYHRILIIIDNFYFGYYPIKGIFRNVLLLLLSRTFTDRIKKLLKK